MPSITLPPDGQNPYGTTLRTAINAINDQVDANTADIADSDATVAGFIDDVDSATRAALVGATAALNDAGVAALVDDSGSLTSAALNSTYVPQAAASMIIFGDSITAQNGFDGPESIVTTGFPVSSRGYFAWANAYLGQRFRWVRNAGIGGNTTTQMLARVQSDVLAYTSDWVIVCGGANDVTNDVPTATIMDNLTAILDALRADGRRVLLTTVPPSTNVNTAPRQAVIHAVNDWIRALPTSRPDVVVADVWRATVDPATGFPAAGNAIDAVHPSEAGASRMGRAIAAALDGVVAPRPAPLVTVTDPRNVIANPDFASSGTGWVVAGSGVSVVYQAHPERAGNQAVVTIAGATDGSERGITFEENISGGRWVVGDTLQMSAVIEWEGASVLTGAAGKTWAPYLRMGLRETGGAFVTFAWGMGVATAEKVEVPSTPAVAGLVTLITPRLVIPAGVNRLYASAGFSGLQNGTVKIRDVSVFKV